jgi:beta-amylase
VGEYQCFDKYMLADLRAAAAAAGHPEWGHGGPHDAGHYNSRSWETGFFKSQGGRWQSEYGHFFQSWYRCVFWEGGCAVVGEEGVCVCLCFVRRG